MKIRLFFLYLSTVFLILGNKNLESKNQRPWEKYLTHDTIQIKIPKLKKIDIKKNIELYLLQDNSLPQINLDIYFENLIVDEPKNKIGLIDLWGRAVVFSGSKKYPKQILADILESQGSHLGFDSSLERCHFSLSNLSHFFIKNLNLLEDIILHPQFNKQDLNLLKRNKLMFIRKRKENPGRLAYILANQLYWKDNVRAEMSTEKTIQNISLADVYSLHKKAISGKKIIAVLTGDFHKNQELPLLINFLKKLSRKNFTNPKNILMVDKKYIPHVLMNNNKKIFVYDKALTQTTVLFTAKGITHHSKDYYALKIFNFLLGGDSFNSHLMQEIRVKNGWAYSAYSHYSADKYSGEIKLFTQTKNQNVEAVIQKIKYILDHPKDFVNKKRIEKAKFSLKNKFLFIFKNPSQIANQLLSIQWDGLSSDYLNTFLSNIDKVTQEDVLRVARKYYQSKNFFVVLVGPKKYLQKKLNMKIEEIKLP